jgi:hypothetical protein
MGKVRLAVLGFRSADAPLSASLGRAAMKVTYLPMVESDHPTAAAAAAAAAEGGLEHLVGYLGTSSGGLGFSIPDVSQGVSQLVSSMVGVAEAPQKDSILHCVYDPWPCAPHSTSSASSSSAGTEQLPHTSAGGGAAAPRTHAQQFVSSENPDISLLYPILQPITAKVSLSSSTAASAGTYSKTKSGTKTDGESAGVGNSIGSSRRRSADSDRAASPAPKVSSMFLPWDKNEAALKVSFIDENHSSFVAGTDEFVSVQLKDIACSAYLQPLKKNPRTFPSLLASSSSATRAAASSSASSASSGTPETAVHVYERSIWCSLSTSASKTVKKVPVLFLLDVVVRFNFLFDLVFSYIDAI